MSFVNCTLGVGSVKILNALAADTQRKVQNSNTQYSLKQLKVDKCSREGWLAPAQDSMVSF